METGLKKLGVHYHAPFHADGGGFRIVSFVGLWLDALSNYWKEVVYVGHETEAVLKSQDYSVKNINRNIRFVSCGPPGGMLTLSGRVASTKRTVEKLGEDIDAMLVRAPSPRQGTVLGAFEGKNKALYLVGEPPKTPLSICFSGGGAKAVIQELLNRRRRAQTTRLARRAVVIANSMELCRRYEARLGKEIFYCPSSSLSENDFHHVEDRCSGDGINLLFVGRVCRAKGVAELIEALARLGAGGMKVSLDVIGDSGDADSVDDFVSLSRKHGVDGVIKWHGRVPYGPELFGFYRQADILVLPSYHEGFPRVIQEAMANGVLVLVTNVGGIGDVCAHGREVYFIDHDPESIAEAVRSVSGDSALRRKMLAGGYAFAKKHLVGENERRLTEILAGNWS